MMGMMPSNDNVDTIALKLPSKNVLPQTYFFTKFIKLVQLESERNLENENEKCLRLNRIVIAH